MSGATLNERAAAQSRLIDLCRLLGEPTPADHSHRPRPGRSPRPLAEPARSGGARAGGRSGFPDRILPRDAKAAAVLKTRTLTNLYNTRGKPEGAWLDALHAALTPPSPPPTAGPPTYPMPRSSPAWWR